MCSRRLLFHDKNNYAVSRSCSSTGGDLGRLGDGPPKNLRWGVGPCIRPHNILRTTVAGCEANYELTKKNGLWKKGHKKFSGVKWKIFRRKGHSEVWPDKFCFPSPNSAPSFRPWIAVSVSVAVEVVELVGLVAVAEVVDYYYHRFHNGWKSEGVENCSKQLRMHFYGLSAQISDFSISPTYRGEQ